MACTAMAYVTTGRYGDGLCSSVPHSYGLHHSGLRTPCRQRGPHSAAAAAAATRGSAARRRLDPRLRLVLFFFVKNTSRAVGPSEMDRGRRGRGFAFVEAIKEDKKKRDSSPTTRLALYGYGPR